MPRDASKVRRRLQEAALKLYQARGYEQPTAADIARAAGVTQRTFFRHFADKREVLFGGESEFINALTNAVLAAAPELGPWKTLLHAFRAVEHVFIENRAFSAPRQLIIDGHPALQERALTKTRAVVSALAEALRRRGVPACAANLVAQMGMTALNHAIIAWLEGTSNDLAARVEQAFRDVHALSSFTAASKPGVQQSKPARGERSV